MGSLFKKHRELLVVGFLLSFAFLAYASQAGQPSVPGPVRRTLVWMTAPVENALIATTGAIEDAWYGYVDLREVRAHNRALVRENLTLQGDAAKLAEVLTENDRLRKMAAFSDATPDLRLIGAPVIAYGPDPKVRSIRIGRGSADGIRPGLPVVTPEGVVGRITQVYDNASDVLLIIDPTSAVAAYTQRTRTRATARGQGDGGRVHLDVRLDFIVKSDDIEEGDILLTAASGGLFPKGLMLGRATNVSDSPGAHGLFKSAELKPAVDFNRLEEVEVIADRGPAAALDAPSTAFFR